MLSSVFCQSPIVIVVRAIRENKFHSISGTAKITKQTFINFYLGVWTWYDLFIPEWEAGSRDRLWPQSLSVPATWGGIMGTGLQWEILRPFIPSQTESQTFILSKNIPINDKSNAEGKWSCICSILMRLYLHYIVFIPRISRPTSTTWTRKIFS